MHTFDPGVSFAFQPADLVVFLRSVFIARRLLQLPQHKERQIGKPSLSKALCTTNPPAALLIRYALPRLYLFCTGGPQTGNLKDWSNTTSPSPICRPKTVVLTRNTI